LQEIYLYYSGIANADVARRRIQSITRDVLTIKSMPNIGQIDLTYPHSPDYRYIVVLDYRIYYYVVDDTVRIASIWDCRQGGTAFQPKTPRN